MVLVVSEAASNSVEPSERSAFTGANHDMFST